MKLTARDRRTIGLGLLIAMPVLTWMLVGRSVWRSLEQLRGDLEQQRSLLARELGLIESQQAGVLIGRHQKARGYVERHTLNAPDATLLYARATAYLTSVASLSGVELQGARAGPEPKGDGALRQLELAVQGRAELSKLLVFLQRVEKGSALIRIERLQISPARARAPGPELDFALTLDVFGALRP